MRDIIRSWLGIDLLTKRIHALEGAQDSAANALDQRIKAIESAIKLYGEAKGPRRETRETVVLDWDAVQMEAMRAMQQTEIEKEN